MWLIFWDNFDEILEITNTPSSEKLKQPVIAVTRQYNVDDVISLRPRDTSSIRKLSDKRRVWVNIIQQMNTIDS